MALSCKKVAAKKTILQNWNFANCEKEHLLEILKIRKEFLLCHANLVSVGQFEKALALTNHLYFDLYLDLLQSAADMQKSVLGFFIK